MIVDFQHHFAPRELVDAAPGAPRVVRFDATGAPAHTSHSLLYELDEHVRIVFATDYPQEIRDTAKVRDFVGGIRALGGAGQDILSGNVGLLLPRLARAA